MSEQRKFATIHSRLLVTSLLPLAVLYFVLVWYMSSSMQSYMRDNLLENGGTATRYLASTSEFAMYSGNTALLEAAGNFFLEVPSVRGVLFYSHAENLAVSIGEIDSEIRVKASLDIPGKAYFFNENWYFYEPIYLNQIPLVDYDEGEPLEPQLLGWVVISFSNELLISEQNKAIYTSVAVSLVGLFFAALLSIRIGWGISRPVQKVTETVEAMSAGNLKLTADESGPLEVEKLARGINQLATSVRESNKRMKHEVELATAQLQDTLFHLEEASEAKDQFLARMSHELRTPLTAVIGFARLMHEEEKRSKREEYRRVIENASTMLLNMIDDVLEFSKTQTGHVLLEEIDFNLSQWLEDVMDLHRQKAEEKNLRLTFDIAPDVPNYLRGDPLRLAQIFNNLISNAIKFTETGYVTVEVKLHSKQGMSVSLECCVKDSGMGIAEEKISSLFDEFVQEDTTINRRFGGTGLGLAICKGLVELMEGDIQIESQIGEGTEIHFTVTLVIGEKSRVKVEEKENQNQVKRDKALESLTILIADDNEFNQKLLSILLSAYGAQCLLASNGEEAIELVEKNYVDIVIMDIHMPIVDGITACERITQLSDSPFVIGLTADITAVEQEKMLQVGAVEVLLKPVDENALIRSIGNLLHENSMATSGGEGLLSSVIPVEELKATLLSNLAHLEEQLKMGDISGTRQTFHDLVGLSGLYGMSELREMVLTLKATYPVEPVEESVGRIAKIREVIEKLTGSE